MRRLLYAFLTYMIVGLLSGFYYRELTKAYNFTGDTQLSVVHTHTLILGMFMFLILIGLEKVFQLSSYYLFNWFFVIYNIGVLTTIGMMATKVHSKSWVNMCRNHFQALQEWGTLVCWPAYYYSFLIASGCLNRAQSRI